MSDGGEANGGSQLPMLRTWPPGRSFPDDEALAAICAACGAPWRIHLSLAGFRLRCECGAWLDLPALPAAAPSTLAAPPEAPLPVPVGDARDQRGLVLLPGDQGETIFTELPTNLPLAPGTLRRASASNQARWTNRVVLEMAALLAALLGPQLLALLAARGQEFELLMPFVSMTSGVLVAIVVAIAGPVGLLGFRPANARAYGLAVLGAGISLLAAFGWLALLKQALPDVDTAEFDRLIERLGLPASLFVIAATPAVLEEVIFRGFLQGRLLALLGTRIGIVVTAAGFAVCHGMPMVLPIHLGIGLLLGWLRQTSGSLWPGMLLHFLYNGALVVLT